MLLQISILKSDGEWELAELEPFELILSRCWCSTTALKKIITSRHKELAKLAENTHLYQNVGKKVGGLKIVLSCLIPYGDGEDDEEEEKDLPGNMGHKHDDAQ